VLFFSLTGSASSGSDSLCEGCSLGSVLPSELRATEVPIVGRALIAGLEEV
jgi:hypothetical protein